MSGLNEAWIARQEATDSSRREHERERIKLWTLDSIADLMVAQNISKADVARKLGTSRAHITQIFSGSKNATLGTLADLAWACGQRAIVKFEPLRSGEFISSPVRCETLPNVVPLKQNAQWTNVEPALRMVGSK